MCSLTREEQILKNYKTEKKKPLSVVILKPLRAGVHWWLIFEASEFALGSAEGKVLRRTELVLVLVLVGRFLRARSVSVVTKKKKNPNMWGSAQVER